jgi:hypothetical protein
MRRSPARAGSVQALPFARGSAALRGAVGIRHAFAVGRPAPVGSLVEILDHGASASSESPSGAAGAGPGPRVALVAAAP